ncbi:MAG: GNAT family N-acetyltransferase [Hamadaea sp.]|uniref:GNAT family N-acetyltransferase n=1 Tax=unclassified Hamadaea TaxID=2640021 RepID=UPI001854D6D7|nr:GNAT family N-acetyltransferase [Hamadaea sp.]NUR51624.1 GNAT family N-acetyltransferase [Hamadaea sp.]NUT07509.1 GNAT family N-acetyltransferase [Hamadaea sp.]
MSRRVVNLTLDTLEDLPRSCRGCVYWELDPVSAERACANGDPGLEKEAWVSQTLLEWGSCGKIVYVDGMPAGFVMYAPPAYVPRSHAFPTSPVSPDAALFMTANVVAPFAGGGLGRMLVQAMARDLMKRGIKAIEAFGDAKFGELDSELGPVGCVTPADFFTAVGFKTVRPHPRFPRLRMELRTALSWKSDVEYALEKLLGSMSPEGLLRPVRPATRSLSGQLGS